VSVIKDPVPFGKRILVARMVPNVGKVILSDDAYNKEQAQIGHILEVGADVGSLQKDQVVVFNRGAGLNISHLFQGVKEQLLVLNEHDVIATLTVGSVIT
jgi:hypothetical protein